MYLGPVKRDYPDSGEYPDVEASVSTVSVSLDRPQQGSLNRDV